MYCFSKVGRLFQVDALPRKLERMMHKTGGVWDLYAVARGSVPECCWWT